MAVWEQLFQKCHRKFELSLDYAADLLSLQFDIWKIAFCSKTTNFARWANSVNIILQNSPFFLSILQIDAIRDHDFVVS